MIISKVLHACKRNLESAYIHYSDLIYVRESKNMKSGVKKNSNKIILKDK